MTGHFEATGVLAALAEHRPVFHSEADFQFAFAWQAKSMDPDFEVRLETHPEPEVRLDLELIEPSGRGIAIELKYMTRRWAGVVRGESYALKNHGASDLRGYDVVKDVVRVERFVAARRGVAGRRHRPDQRAWRLAITGTRTRDQRGRIPALRRQDALGRAGLGPNTGGTARGREAPPALRGTHALAWVDYSKLDGTAAGTFRALVIPIATDASPEPGSPTCSTT